MAVKVVDRFGNAHDWAWVRNVYGEVSIAPTEGDGYKVVQLTEVEGWMGATCTVLNAGGGAVVGQQVAYMWPDGEAVEITNGSGTAEHIMGPGEGYWLPGPGPISWQVRGAASERISGLGWLNGTNHLHLQVLMQWNGGGEEPPPGEDGDVAEAILAVAAELKRGANALWAMVKALEK